jgi:hypothetical protein
MDRSTVKQLHRAVDAALKQAASTCGFDYQPGGMRFTDVEVTGRMRFVVHGKQAVVAAQTNAYALDGLKVGDTVQINGRGETYKILQFNPRGGSRIQRLSNGKVYRCAQVALTKPGEKMKLTEAHMAAIVRRAVPGLSQYAAELMVDGWRWGAVGKGEHGTNKVPMPTIEAEIETRVNEEMKKVMEDVKRFKDPKLSPAQWLNDLASERRAEARMS